MPHVLTHTPWTFGLLRKLYDATFSNVAEVTYSKNAASWIIAWPIGTEQIWSNDNQMQMAVAYVTDKGKDTCAGGRLYGMEALHRI